MTRAVRRCARRSTRPAASAGRGRHTTSRTSSQAGLALIGLAIAASSGDPAAAAPPHGTLKKIKETGAITLGHREYSVPFSYYDDRQQAVGYAMDLCYRIVAAVKRDLALDKL